MMAPGNDQLIAESVRGLITSYHELNPNCVDELEEEPSPLEFMRYVATNRPFVIRGGASSWPSHRKWNAAYLKEVMAGQHVNVAITNRGNADAIVESEEQDGSLVFVEPYEREELFSDVIDKVQAQELGNAAGEEPKVIRYAQTQNDNLRNEYSSLFADVPRDIPFARIALQPDAAAGPDAVNFWLGSSRSTTSLHKDNYENVYVQVLGRKHFTLLPPVEAACVNERAVPAGRYVPRARSGVEREGEEEREVELHDLRVEMARPERMVNWALWDPDLPAVRPTAFSGLSRPVRVTLEPGDMLYLPAMWYHKVAQSCSEEGICVAVNYWYDMDFSGPFWSFFSFARSVGGVANGYPLTERGGEEEEDECQ
ncbi:Phospholipase [Lasiodiplodia theobromae]|uniref:Phospholipase n=1 Tax=Lasiodiplodia theobromae TaxID=45133 RepID=UPI0015C36800|nr:Phospholipase [Lasiodiplodia theobromae]KAF4546213.1 Phospholipase [Lasiodiplodia theobromae]